MPISDFLVSFSLALRLGLGIAGLDVGAVFCNGIRRSRVYESGPVGLTRHLKLKIDKGKANVNANNQRTAARSRLG